MKKSIVGLYFGLLFLGFFLILWSLFLDCLCCFYEILSTSILYLWYNQFVFLCWWNIFIKFPKIEILMWLLTCYIKLYNKKKKHYLEKNLMVKPKKTANNIKYLYFWLTILFLFLHFFVNIEIEYWPLFGFFLILRDLKLLSKLFLTCYIYFSIKFFTIWN